MILPKGYIGNATSAKIKKDGSDDLSIVFSKFTAKVSLAATKNIVKGHSLMTAIENAKNKNARCILINAGNANACVGPEGLEDANLLLSSLSLKLNIQKEDIIFNSTGVIGKRLNTSDIIDSFDKLIIDMDQANLRKVPKAIMTTDTVKKEISIPIKGTDSTIYAVAKGSGMIHPDMATMISLILTDIDIDKDLLDSIFKDIVNKTFNRTSVDGDTSVCDMAVIMANGASGDNCLDPEDVNAFKEALFSACHFLSKEIAKDGEGATKLIEVLVSGAKTAEDAYKIVLAVSKSPLVKTAFFGEDANWGRIITACGYSGASFDPEKTSISIGELKVFDMGRKTDFSESLAKTILQKDDIKVLIELNDGDFNDRMFTCDFSYDYVKINGSYRT